MIVAISTVRTKCANPEISRGKATTTRRTHCFQPNDEKPLRAHTNHAATVTIKTAVVIE